LYKLYTQVMKPAETRKRSLLKAITYRVLIIISDGIVVFALTGDLSLTAGVVTLTSVVNTLMYFVHERGWSLVKWGRKQ
jgi:uncharacterized membrane protein